MGEIVKFDKDTEKWFRERCCSYLETTLARCEDCGLYYKHSLGHKCKRRKSREE